RASCCHSRARLASGWLAGLYREGVEPSGSLRKVSDHMTILLSCSPDATQIAADLTHRPTRQPWANTGPPPSKQPQNWRRLNSELPTWTRPMSHGSTAALTPAQSTPLSLVARVVRIGLRMVAKPVLRANPSVEAARWQLRLADRLIPRPPRGTETIAIDAGGVPAERVATAASRHDRHIIY